MQNIEFHQTGQDEERRQYQHPNVLRNLHLRPPCQCETSSWRQVNSTRRSGRFANGKLNLDQTYQALFGRRWCPLCLHFVHKAKDFFELVVNEEVADQEVGEVAFELGVSTDEATEAESIVVFAD